MISASEVKRVDELHVEFEKSGGTEWAGRRDAMIDLLLRYRGWQYARWSVLDGSARGDDNLRVFDERPQAQIERKCGLVMYRDSRLFVLAKDITPSSEEVARVDRIHSWYDEGKELERLNVAQLAWWRNGGKQKLVERLRQYSGACYARMDPVLGSAYGHSIDLLNEFPELKSIGLVMYRKSKAMLEAPSVRADLQLVVEAPSGIFRPVLTCPTCSTSRSQPGLCFTCRRSAHVAQIKAQLYPGGKR